MKLLTALIKHYKTCSFLLGIVSVASLPPYYIFPAAIFSFSILFYFLHKASNYKSSFAIGYWFGFGHFSIGLSWVANALLVDAVTFGWLYPIAILSAGAFFGLFSGFATTFVCKFRTPISQLLSLSAFWTLSEWIRSFILTGFPWNLIGSTLTFSPELYQSASIFGTYGLSLITIIFCTTPALLFFPQRKNKISALFILLLLPLSNYFYGTNRINQLAPQLEHQGLKIRIVQPSIAQNLKWNLNTLEQNFAQHIELSQQNGLENIDIVIWGETATPFTLDTDEQHRQQILKAIPEYGYLITGTVRIQSSPYGRPIPFNSMLAFNKQGTIVASYDKSHLVPFGEYIPLRKYFPDWIKPITNTITDFQAGTGPRSINIPNIPPFGTLICYEIIFPAQIVNKNDRPEWLINLTNDGWYGDSAGPHQHLVSTILRATEEGLTTVRIANNGISASINPLGQILEKLPLNHVGILDTVLPQKLSISTTYAQYGNIIPLTLIAIIFLIAIFGLFSSNPQK